MISSTISTSPLNLTCRPAAVVVVVGGGASAL
jgi:hypothetical protein